MRIENVSISFSQKFNLGNYESFEVSAMVHAKVDADESSEAVGEFCSLQAKEIVYKAAKEILDSHEVVSPSVKKFYMGQECNALPSEALHEFNNIIDDTEDF